MKAVTRPVITLKLATTLDGRIATHGGLSRWITGEDARRCVHELRAGHDAVLVGIETALKDDPELSIRLPGYEGYQPARVILDTNARLPLSSKLAQTARIIPTYLVSAVEPDPKLIAAGVKSVRVPTKHQKTDLDRALQALYDEGLERLFVEGGAQVATAFLKAGYVDRLEWFRSPTVLGADSKPVFGFLNIDDLGQMIRFERLGVQAVGEDLWETYEIMENL
jgi:diaminohydroxyphosphoribosylaminopyrimidine deaminase / 5-amino-6-(5-phosphoribosylamino)uracil reductase